MSGDPGEVFPTDEIDEDALLAALNELGGK
jgi:hypothetical protein